MASRRSVRRRSLLVATAFALVVSACGGSESESSLPGVFTPGVSNVIVEGVVTDTGRLITVVPTKIIYHLPERWSVGLGQIIQIPVPALGEELTARTSSQDLPTGTPLIMAFSYIPRTTDWNWALEVAFFPEDQRPVDGFSSAWLQQLDRLLFEGEDPTRDTVRALIELIEEGRDASFAVHVFGAEEFPLGPRQVAFFGREAPPTQAEVDAARLASFLATPASERLLSEILEDIPPGADTALGVDWAWRELVVAYDRASLGYGFIGLRAPGVGFLGPVSLTSDPIIPLDAYLPRGRPFEVLAWPENIVSRSSSDSAVVLGTVDDPAVISALDAEDGRGIFLDLRNGFDVTVMSGANLSAMVGGILSESG